MFWDDDEAEDDDGIDDSGDDQEEDPAALRAELKACRLEISATDDHRLLRKWLKNCTRSADHESVGPARRVLYGALVDAIEERMSDLQAAVLAEKTAALLQASTAAAIANGDAAPPDPAAIALARARRRLDRAEANLPEEDDLERLREVREAEYRRLVRGGRRDWWDVQARLISVYDDRIKELASSRRPSNAFVPPPPRPVRRPQPDAARAVISPPPLTTPVVVDAPPSLETPADDTVNALSIELHVAVAPAVTSGAGRRPGAV